MASLSVEQKSIRKLLGEVNFLIPVYQRQYDWEERECSRLWEDLFSFAFSKGDNFDKDNDEYFLGPIVTFPRDKNGKIQEVIDGHQRLITLLLLLRALYTDIGEKSEKYCETARKNIEKCIWETDEAEEPDINKFKIETLVATDEAKQEFRDILRTGQAISSQKSRYADNYRFFQKQIEELSQSYFDIEERYNFPLMAIRIMNNCMLLPIEADEQDTALQIFSTLNDRGKPLSDSDIFKAQLYEYYDKQTPSRKDEFIERWKQLEERCTEIYQDKSLDEAFIRYMYYERAKMKEKSSTIEALRKFYEVEAYRLLKRDTTFDNIIDLTNFWYDLFSPNSDRYRFSEQVLKRLYVLKFSPNSMWEYIVSVYYMYNRDSIGMLDDEAFFTFLNKLIAFLLGYLLMGKSLSDLRAPIYAEMVNIVEGRQVEFKNYRFNSERLVRAYKNYEFTNKKALTKLMLAWWAFKDEEQTLPPFSESFATEYIYSKSLKHELKDPRNIELLGNRSLLEKSIDIKSSDKRFVDKARYYTGAPALLLFSKRKQGTRIKDLRDIAKNFADFTERDIIQRNDKILREFIAYVKANGLLE